MFTMFVRPFYLLLIFISVGLGLFFGTFPPDLSTASTFGRLSAFLGTFMILAAMPTMILYFKYKTALGEKGFSGYFWRVVQFSLSGSIMVAIMAFIGFTVLPFGYLAAFSGIALLAYILIAHALNLLEHKLFE
jgi:hypothetical protein